MPVPSARIHAPDPCDMLAGRSYVLYWCVAQRRVTFNFALDYAIEQASKANLPLVIFEPLRAGYRWNSQRHHRFVIEGMRDNQEACAAYPNVEYYPYVEPKSGDAKGLLDSLSREAALVVSDCAPYFFFPKMQERATQDIKAPLVLIDSNGIVPTKHLLQKWSSLAHSFRRRTRDFLTDALEAFPSQEPLAAALGPKAKLKASITKRWPKADIPALLANDGLSQIAFDNLVAPATLVGGSKAGLKVLDLFADDRLRRYLDDRLNLDEEACSGLSPWLHFGHVSAHQVFRRTTEAMGWHAGKISDRPHLKREGWWGAEAPLDAFLDELVTWRELGFHTCAMRNDYASLSSTPEWAQATLQLHRSDQRPYIYDLETLAKAETHDPVWNAAQRQLLSEGRIHNAIRMVWGKRVIAWTATPEIALDCLIELNNRYALDGRDPNSYSGILWCFGRHDRAWGPEREIFGKVRYMTSESFKRKSKSKSYFERWGAASP